LQAELNFRMNSRLAEIRHELAMRQLAAIQKFEAEQGNAKAKAEYDRAMAIAQTQFEHQKAIQQMLHELELARLRLQQDFQAAEGQKNREAALQNILLAAEKQFELQVRLERLRDELERNRMVLEQNFRALEGEKNRNAALQNILAAAEAQLKIQQQLEEMRQAFGRWRVETEQAFWARESAADRAAEMELVFARAKAERENIERRYRLEKEAAAERPTEVHSSWFESGKLTVLFKTGEVRTVDMPVGEKPKKVQYASVQGKSLIVVYDDGSRDIVNLKDVISPDKPKVKSTVTDAAGRVWFVFEDGSVAETNITTDTKQFEKERLALEAAIRVSTLPDAEGGGVDWQQVQSILEQWGMGEFADRAFAPRRLAQIQKEALEEAEQLWELQQGGVLQRVWRRLFGSSGDDVTRTDIYQRILAQKLAAAGMSAAAPQTERQEPGRSAAPTQSAGPEADTPPAIDVSRLEDGTLVHTRSGRVWEVRNGRLVRRRELETGGEQNEKPARRAM